MANRAAALLSRAEVHPDKVALVFEGTSYSFGELARRVREAAGGLARLGIGCGMHVGIMLPSSPDFIIVQQALFALGAVVSPLNIFYRPGEVLHAIRSCDLEFLVLPADLLDRAPAGDGALRSIIVTDAPASPGAAHASLADAIALGAPCETLAPVAAGDVVMLLLTSATTGKSKGVMLTAANLAANYDRTPQWLDVHADDVVLGALPLYNTFGLNQCINTMTRVGATLVLLPRFDPEACVDAIARHGCTFVPAVPTMLGKIVDQPGAGDGALRTVRCIMTGGAPVPAALLRRVLHATGAKTVVLTGYGLTEATALVTLTRVSLDADGAVEHGRTIGRVLDGMQIGIMNDDGRVLDADTVGEIVVRGPNVMAGYYRNPDATADAFAGDWLRTGDLGTLSADGYAYIVDRKKDVIIRGGQNIYPADIEEVLYDVPGVTEAAVVGIDDDVFGEVPFAFVALRADAAVSTALLLDRCRTELAHYKVPVAIRILEALPKGATGKILRRELRAHVSKETVHA